MSEPSNSRDDNEENKPRKCSFKLIAKKKKITKKSARISIGECDRQQQQQQKMGKTWGDKESAASYKDRKTNRTGSRRERWLLTRKTWRYMADAGRKLIPDGAGNRPEDVPKIEAYFQEVCQKEPRFLLWRKQSYPGALGFRSRGRPRGNRGTKLGSVRENASCCSADEAENAAVKVPPGSVSFLARPGPAAGRYELERLRKDFLFGTTENDGAPLLSDDCPQRSADLVRFITDCISADPENSSSSSSPPPQTQPQPPVAGAARLDHEQLLGKLEDYMSKTSEAAAVRAAAAAAAESQQKSPLLRISGVLESDNTQKNLLETLRRYYARSTNRDKVIGDILMDRKLLETLYFELRKTRGFLGRRVTGSTSSLTLGVTNGSSDRAAWNDNHRKHDRVNTSSDYLNIFNDKKNKLFFTNSHRHNMSCAPPVIEIEGAEEAKHADVGVQTVPLEPAVMGLIEDENRRKLQDADQNSGEHPSKAQSKALQRKASMENDDVSPSVSDTIKRYLRMARKKSVDSDKADRFKRVNYDRNIRNIKGKGEPDVCEGDDTNRAVQTDDSWVSVLKTVDDGGNSRITSSRSSIDTGTTFSGEELLLSPPPVSPPKSLNGKTQ